MSPEQEKQLIKIGKDVAKKSRLTDKEEALSIALFGMARGLAHYDPAKGTKLTTYLYRCAQLECWVEWRKGHRIKRGRGVKEVSLDEMLENGLDIHDDTMNLM